MTIAIAIVGIFALAMMLAFVSCMVHNEEDAAIRTFITAFVLVVTLFVLALCK